MSNMSMVFIVVLYKIHVYKFINLHSHMHVFFIIMY